MGAADRFVPRGCRIVELYAGVGIIGLSVGLHKAQWIRCSDENPANVRAFNRLRSRLAVEHRWARMRVHVCTYVCIFVRVCVTG